MKRQVTLQFLSLNSLKALQMKINLIFFEVSAQGKLLHCACTDEQVALAKAKFNAVIVDKNGVRQPSMGA
jgi:hypothetical protein